MKTVTSVEDVRRAVADARVQGLKVGLVPTMGALHEGHALLMDRSVSECGFTVVSIFVNALQFGPTEDFNQYPRGLHADEELCLARGVDLIFAPSHEAMYPREQRAFVEVAQLTETLCGAQRPGHFRGVTTVVAKLLHIVGPDVAYFGQKDAQQAAVIRRMVDDLNFPTAVRVVPTVRDEDGLAKSSRNRYLSPEERRAAVALFRGLARAQEALNQGERDAAAVKAMVRSELAKERLVRAEYVEVVDAWELQPVRYIDGSVLVAVAAQVGKTRLIDNLIHPREG